MKNELFTLEQIKLMTSATGFFSGVDRNHYVVHSPSIAWQDLVTRGFATVNINFGQCTYHVTDLGKKALLYLK